MALVEFLVKDFMKAFLTAVEICRIRKGAWTSEKKKDELVYVAFDTWLVLFRVLGDPFVVDPWME